MLSVCAVYGAGNAAFAQVLDWRGHLKYQPAISSYDDGSIFAQLGPSTVLTHEVDGRAVMESRLASWSLNADAELLGIAGSGLAAAREAASVDPRVQSKSLLISDDARIADATIELVDGADAESVLRLDRLHGGWSSEYLVLQVGRQAVTWGNGLVFSVFDLFNPFSPIAIDKEYKTGDDMLNGQVLFPDGGDIQLLAVGRRNPDTHSIESGESSYAAKYHRQIAALSLDTELLAARHYDENVFGLGFSRSIRDAVLRIDGVMAQTSSDGDRAGFTINLDRTWTLAERNVYAFLEYYRNGFGVADGEYQNASIALLERLGRGEVYTMGRDYLTCGFELEASPLVKWFSSSIFNLHDESGFIQQRISYEVLQSLIVTIGANIPYGGSGSEFGGIAVSPDSFISPGLSFYLRSALYF